MTRFVLFWIGVVAAVFGVASVASGALDLRLERPMYTYDWHRHEADTFGNAHHDTDPCAPLSAARIGGVGRAAGMLSVVVVGALRSDPGTVAPGDGSYAGASELRCGRIGETTTNPTKFVATESAPGIKPGAANGETAGKAFPKSVRDAALEENPNTCVYCRGKTDSPQVDHAIPKSRGGDATIENAQTTCQHCNASKGARDFPVTPPKGYRGPWPPPWWKP